MSLLDNPQVKAALNSLWATNDSSCSGGLPCETYNAQAALLTVIEAAVREEYDGTTGAMPCPECAAGLCIEVNGKESKLHFAYNSPVVEAVKEFQMAYASWNETLTEDFGERLAERMERLRRITDAKEALASLPPRGGE